MNHKLYQLQYNRSLWEAEGEVSVLRHLQVIKNDFRIYSPPPLSTKNCNNDIVNALTFYKSGVF